MPTIARSKAKKQPEIIAVRAAIYLRVSTEEQAADGFGLDEQRDRCRAMITVKGWSLAGEYADEGISGTKDATERPALARLLADVEAGQIEAVIVLGLDRLGRKTRIILDLVESLTDAGAELVSCKESLDTTTAAGRFVLTIFAALAQLERDNIVERTTGGRNQRGKRDGEKGGMLPYGYLRDEGAIRIDQPAAHVVRTIFRLRRRKASLRAIAASLATPPPRGCIWRASAIASILAHEDAYRGGVRGESTVRWPRIL